MDITTLFTNAANQLQPGELVQEINFSLFDAMSAIELMDTKMDAVLQWKTFGTYPRTVSEAAERGVVKFDGHKPEELVGIIDEVLACVATWLDGHTLAQTVFTSMYLLDTSRIENLYLRASTQAIVKTVEYMRTCICQGRVFSEDDQQGVCFGFDMLNRLSETSITTALKEAEDKLAALVKHPRNSTLNDSACVESLDVWRALLYRVKFLRNFYAFVVAMSKNTPQGIEIAIQKLTQCASMMEEMKRTLDCGVKVDASDPLSLGFHPVINQHLLPPSYKAYAILPRPKAFELLHTIVVQLQKVFTFGKLDTFRELYRSIKDFCSVKDSPNVFVRSILVLVCVQGDRKKLFGSPPIEALLREDTKFLTFPPSLNPRSPLSSSPQGKEGADRFFGRALAPMLDFLHTFCQHRARQRYKITRCLDVISEFQHESQRIDEILNSLSSKIDPLRQHLACFSTWILYYILQLMMEFIYLGFEYNLYSPFEMHYVYWYLEFLYGWHQTMMKSAERLVLAEPPVSGKGKRKAAKRNKRELIKEKDRETAIMHAKRLTCLGVMRGLEALLLDKKIPQPVFEMSSEQICFHNRFLPFASLITPQLLTYDDYMRLASVQNYQGKDLNLYEASAKHFLTARSAVEGIPHRDEELENLYKVIKTNIVIMNLSSKGHKRDSKLPPVFDFSMHKHFPVIRIN